MTSVPASTSLSAALVLDAQADVLQQLRKLRQYLSNLGSHEGLVDEERSKAWTRVIDEETYKVERLELTLAFIGTMKAGKSMMINAIVGQEILPTRSTAMTILPTVISHAKGQTIPVLTFSHPTPFNNTIKAIKKKLRQLDTNKQPFATGDRAMDETLADIRSNALSKVRTRYEGSDGIRRFMTCLNDIVRVCVHPQIAVPSPLDSYHKLAHYPTINVEFTYLKEKAADSAFGTLSLVDTPGPNEAGQQHLKYVVRQQLQDASAVISILDYTQLNTDSDDEVRTWIKKASGGSGPELFVLVNKFDQRDRNSYGYEDTVRYVRDNLYTGEGNVADGIDGRIYPCSALLGFLSNCALQAVKRDGRIPDDESWVEDYARAGFGQATSAPEAVERDVDEHLRVIGSMWRSSMMEGPLQHVVAASLEKVVPECLQSALGRIGTIASSMDTGITIRRGSVAKDIRDLEIMIAGLQESLDELKAARQQVESVKAESEAKVASVLDACAEKIRGMGKRTIEKHIQDEVQRLLKAVDTEKPASSWKGISAAAKRLFGVGQFWTHRDIKNFIDDRHVDFRNAEEAQSFCKDLLDWIEHLMKQQIDAMVSELEIPINRLQTELSTAFNEVIEPIMSRVSEGIRDEFLFEIEYPAFELPPISTDLKSIADMGVEMKTLPYTYRERRWYTLWLYQHEVSSEREVHRVDSEQIFGRVSKEINELISEVKATVEGYLSMVYGEKTARFFADLEDIIGGLQNDVLGGMRLRQQERSHREALLRVLKETSVGLGQLLTQNGDVSDGFGRLLRRLS